MKKRKKKRLTWRKLFDLSTKEERLDIALEMLKRIEGRQQSKKINSPTGRFSESQSGRGRR